MVRKWILMVARVYGVLRPTEGQGIVGSVTENGVSCRDWPSLDGRVHDAQRVDFLTRHLRQLHRAVAEGVPVEGYFHWSALDNFEWAEGYRERFGLIYVDYATGERIPKDSYHWYAQVIAAHRQQAGVPPAEQR